MKIVSYASKSTADLIEPRQHFFLSNALSTTSFLSSSFQQLTPPWFDLIKRSSASISFYHRSHTDQHFNSWSLRNQTRISPAPISIIDPYRSTFDLFSAGITPRKQHHMKVFGDFHIEGYFHLFFFMSWILNFISIHPINGMNKWSILIIYSFMK